MLSSICNLMSLRRRVVELLKADTNLKKSKKSTEIVYLIWLSKVSNQGDKRSQTKKAGICKDVCREISKTNYVIYLTIIVRFDFTFSKTILQCFICQNR